MGHHTPLAVVEQFGILDAVHPGRIDLGLGRSGFKRLQQRSVEANAPTPTAPATAPPAGPAGRRTEHGLLIPPPYSYAHLIGLPAVALQMKLLQQPNAETPDYAEQIDDILALIGGTYRGPDGTEAHVVPVKVPSSRCGSWAAAGATAPRSRAPGLPFAANYHVAPSSVLEAVEAYRSAFRPSATLSRPHVSVSADVVVAPTDAEARELATGYAPWVRSIRTAEGAIQFPTPDEARARRGRPPIKRWCRTASTPSSSDRRSASPSRSASWPTRPEPTSC